MPNDDEEHERALIAHVELSRALDTAWDAALIVSGGCVACSEREIRQLVAGRAYSAGQWFMGQQPDHEPAIIPQQRAGIRMTSPSAAFKRAPFRAILSLCIQQLRTTVSAARTGSLPERRIIVVCWTCLERSFRRQQLTNDIEIARCLRRLFTAVQSSRPSERHSISFI